MTGDTGPRVCPSCGNSTWSAMHLIDCATATPIPNTEGNDPMNIADATALHDTVDEHEQMMLMADRELDHRVKALRAAAAVLTGKNDAKGAFAPGGATPAAPADLISVGDWLLDDIALPATAEPDPGT